MFYKALMLSAWFVLPALISSCNKEGCPANQALYNEAMGGPSKKKSKPPKNKSGIIPDAKNMKKY